MYQFTNAVGMSDIVAVVFNPRENKCISMVISKIKTYVILLFVIVISAGIFFFFSRKTQINPVTGKKQYIILKPHEEVALGIQSAPDIAVKFGGLYGNTDLQNRIKNIGRKLAAVSQVSKAPYQFDFHVLADSQTINAFSFPGGQVFITKGLLDILKTDDELAALLSHEIGHVIARHAGEKLSEYTNFREFSNDTIHISEYSSEAMNEYIINLTNINFDDSQEVEVDHFGIIYMKASGYNPAVLPEILRKLEAQSESRQIEYIQKHPVSESRLENIQAQVKKVDKR